MSFLRHWRSIVRWVLFHKPEAKWCSTSPLPLIGMMSRSHLFLSGLVSTRARLRFGGRFYLLPIGRIRKPGRHKVAHFSTGTMPHFQPELTLFQLHNEETVAFMDLLKLLSWSETEGYDDAEED